jgi:hypothetical protein
MGNWRTVRIVGTCAPSDVRPLAEALTVSRGDFEGFHCLTCGGLCGLRNWAAPTIDVIGNLAERDYSIDTVRETLQQLLVVAPSLRVDVHCGGDNEDQKCVETLRVEVERLGLCSVPVVKRLPPQVAEIGDMMENESPDDRVAREFKSATVRR